MAPPASSPRFPWKGFFHRSATAVFVLGPNRRLRYANPAWEAITGKSLATLRGTRVSTARESASPLWKALAPPAGAWAGGTAQVRRPLPEHDHGPPWWDVTFVPLAQPAGTAVVGFVTQIGTTPERHAFREPAALAAARADHAKTFTLDLFAGDTPAMHRLRDLLRTAAAVPASVWIHGGRGSGKQTAARVIHHLGPHRELPFVALDCGRLQPYMIEQLAFGRGGFAGTRAVGTLLLKHPAGMPRDLQAKFVAWAEAKHPPRFICVGNGRAENFEGGESLVPGFLAKLATLEIDLPPLRDRLDELPGIVERFGVGPCEESVWPVLRSHPWAQGNLRELRHAMSEAKANAGDAPIRADHLSQPIRESKLIADAPPVKWTPLAEVVERAERGTIETTLGLCGGKVAVAAERLGLPRSKLVKRMKALGIDG